jgi:hypothetical protein
MKLDEKVKRGESIAIILLVSCGDQQKLANFRTSS